MKLDNFFRPESIAVAGVENDPLNAGYRIVKNILKNGFRGTVVPLSECDDKIMGFDCYRDLNDYGEPVDLVIIVSNKSAVLDAVRDAVDIGVTSLLILTSGFRETGKEGLEIEREIVEICQSRGARVMGPNSDGVLNVVDDFNASRVSIMPFKGHVSIFSQSGPICEAMLEMANERGLGISKVSNIGNKADINETDMIKYYGQDDSTEVVLGYLENIFSGDNFVKNASEVSLKKPVIIMKSGITGAGKRVAASHTGVLSTVETAYGAAFKRAGVIRADSFQEVFDYAAAFSIKRLPTNKRIMVIASAGGAGIVAADEVEKNGMEVAEIDISSFSFLHQVGDKYLQSDSPVLIVGDLDAEKYALAVKEAVKNNNVDSVLIVIAPGIDTSPAAIRGALDSLEEDFKKPVLISHIGRMVISDEKAGENNKIPVYPSPKRAIAALKVMYEYYLWKNRPPRIVTRFGVNRRRVERIVRRHIHTKRLFLGEVKAKRILDAYGFTTLSGGLASTADEAVDIASHIGYPVAVKIVSPDVIHKTDLGGVKLNITDPEAVRDAFDLIMLRIKQKQPTASIEGVYVEKMAGRGLEVIIGMHREAVFGPMLMFGLGGIFVEVMKDVTFYLAPITSEEAIQMLKSTRSYEILEGKRGAAGVDINAIAGCLQRISQLTTDFPEIMELDINPLIVGGGHDDPVVVDARITLSEMTGRWKNILGENR